MSEVFTKIVDINGQEGRTERFVNFEVHVSGLPLEVDLNLLDDIGNRNLHSYASEGKCSTVAGTARISWKSEADRDACIASHAHNDKRKQRWRGVQEILQRMHHGEFPQFAHAYIHPSLTERDDLIVIDGTRRMIAYLLFGRKEMPVVVFRACELFE